MEWPSNDILLNEKQRNYPKEFSIINYFMEEKPTQVLINGKPMTTTLCHEQLIKRRESIAEACKKYRKKKKETIQCLRKRKLELQEQIHEMKIMRGLDRNSMILCSKWEAEALEQRFQTQASIRRNEELKQAIQTQMKLNESLRKIIQKQPIPSYALSKYLSEEWREYRLSIDPKERIRTMHSIADAQMDLLSSVLLRANLYDTPNKNLILDRCFQENGKFTSIEIVRNRIYEQVDSSSLVFSTHQVFLGNICVPEDIFEIRFLQQLDENLYYVENCFSSGANSYLKRVVMKRYDLENRFIIVWKTIHYDPLSINQDAFVGNEAGWIVCNELAEMKGCVQKLIVHMQSPLYHTRQLHILTSEWYQCVSKAMSALEDLIEFVIRYPEKVPYSLELTQVAKKTKLLLLQHSTSF